MGKGQVYQNHLEVLQTAGSSLTPQLLSHCPKGLAEPPATYASTYTLVCCYPYVQVIVPRGTVPPLLPLNRENLTKR